MAKKLQLRRGTTTQHNSFTGDVGECTVDTDKDTLVVHDNSTQGGFPLARENLSNVSSATIISNIDDDSVTYAKLQNVAANRMLGNNTGSAADAIELTATQVRTFLNVADGSNAYTHPNHSGDVTSTGDGATTIANDAVTYAKMQNVSATDRILGRDSAGAGNVEEITPANVRTMLNVADGANNYSHPNHSGDVTSSGDGATTIANDAVTYAKMQNVSATDRLLGRSSSGAGNVEEITCTAAGRALLDDADAAAQRTTLAVSGTGTVNTFTRTQSVTPDDGTSDTTLDMSLSNFIQLGNTNISGDPTNLVIGTSGVFHCASAAPSGFHNDFKFPGGSYTAPTSFPAIAPWYIAADNTILVGSWTEDITRTS